MGAIPEGSGEPASLDEDQRPRTVEVPEILEGGHGGDLGQAIHVERRPGAVKLGQDLGARDGIAHPQSRQPGDRRPPLCSHIDTCKRTP